MIMNFLYKFLEIKKAKMKKKKVLSLDYIFNIQD